MKVVKTSFRFDYQNNWHDLISALCTDEQRNAQIIEDILAETAETRKRAVVFSERTEHLRTLMDGMAQRNPGMIDGTTTQKQTAEIFRRYNRGKTQIIFCTYKSMEKLREIERAHHLFITTPVRYSEPLAQMTSMLMNEKSVIYDYHDTPKILKGALKQRLKFFRKIGCGVR